MTQPDQRSSFRIKVFALVIIVAGLVLSNLAIAPSVNAGPPEVSSLRTDGKTIVWIYSAGEDHLYSAGTDSPDYPRLIAQGHDIRSADVSGNRVVWIQNNRLTGQDLVTGQPLDLPASSESGAMDAAVSLDGSHMVWLHRPGASDQWQILMANLDSADDPVVVATLPAGNRTLHRPVVSGDRVVWGISGSAGADFQWELWTVQLGDSPLMIASGTTALNLNGYDIAGSTVVYGANQSVYAVDLDEPASNGTLSQHGRLPTTDGRYVFWVDTQNLPQSRNPIGYDLQTGSYFSAPSGQYWIHQGVWTRDGVVSWMTLQENVGFVAYADSIAEWLPSAPLPHPGKTDRAWLYFDKTGHYISYGFKDFWQRSGGLPVFGYPLTTEFSELNPELGELRTVQYLERQRFEYHPAYAGTPYETLLGRLGDADALDRELFGTPAFQPLPATTAPGANVDFFPQTGHRLSGGFRTYWHSHGLDFGDPGVTYRESLALFGFPISEEFVDPDTGLTTQYFERAVFEYHPDNPDPYKVLLRRLGAEQIQARDW